MIEIQRNAVRLLEVVNALVECFAEMEQQYPKVRVLRSDMLDYLDRDLKQLLQRYETWLSKLDPKSPLLNK
ncbi:MAG: hypothetical protein PHU08_06340 [Dehalococcoidales bacterium]|nr:hypothetical protein [Dehalococcoidales bacterium]